MSERFYAPVSFDRPEVELTGPEAHHLANVLRMKAGQQVVLFDGEGHEATAEIAAVSKKSVSLRVLASRRSAADRRVPLVLATAVPKGERFRWLVEKATELGVDRLVPLETERSVVDPGAGKLEKMRQTVIAACKQSGRARLMEIAGTLSWSDFLAQEATPSIFVAHPWGEPIRAAVASRDPGLPAVLAVGPEGGFTDQEIEAAINAGARTVALGPRILRTETAAVALSAWFGVE